MKKILSLVAAALALVAGPASAQVTFALDETGNDFFTLSTPGSCTPGPCTMTATGVTGNIVGGTIWSSDQPFADIPAGGVVGSRFLAAGPSSGLTSTVTFSSGLDYVGFLWGSPDLYNSLTVVTTLGNLSFTAASLGLGATNGNQSFSQYVAFIADAGADITGFIFSNSSPTDAFEVANFNTMQGQTGIVPEPETYALMLAGLGAVGFISRRRRRQQA